MIFFFYCFLVPSRVGFHLQTSFVSRFRLTLVLSLVFLQAAIESEYLLLNCGKTFHPKENPFRKPPLAPLARSRAGLTGSSSPHFSFLDTRLVLLSSSQFHIFFALSLESAPSIHLH